MATCWRLLKDLFHSRQSSFIILSFYHHPEFFRNIIIVESEQYTPVVGIGHYKRIPVECGPVIGLTVGRIIFCIVGRIEFLDGRVACYFYKVEAFYVFVVRMSFLRIYGNGTVGAAACTTEERWSEY